MAGFKVTLEISTEEAISEKEVTAFFQLLDGYFLDEADTVEMSVDAITTEKTCE